MKFIVGLVLVHMLFPVLAQETAGDSSKLLREVVIEAYETNRELGEVPASVGFLRNDELQRYNNTSILPAVNNVPGVRMEERSPGSYRFSIRGSSLRSPFGVRNVKAYWNGLPFTDGGGNTYLNLLDFSSIGTLEIIKGPGGSLYGAGTGGVLLIRSPEVTGDRLMASAVFGSYGLQRYLLGGQLKRDRVVANVQVAHHTSDGYREQTALRRNAVNADMRIRSGRKATVRATLVFSDLYYETPGGLTQAQYLEDPRQARPPSASLGAVEARAAVTNRTTYGGVVYEREWNDRWSGTAGLYASFSDFANPTIRNYEQREETNFGLRAHAVYRLPGERSSVEGKITLGGEYQYFTSPVGVYGNIAGRRDTVQVRDDLTSSGSLFFAQADLELPGSFFVTAGASINFLHYGFTRLEPAPVVTQDRTFDAVFSPRLAVLKKFSDELSLYASYSDGFSPPSLAEVRPSTNTFNGGLKAESGNNAEFGARGAVLDKRLTYDLAVYDFRLRNTIVVQRNVDGADYFINAGKTSQRGVEAYAAYELVKSERLLSELKVWASYAYQHYRFQQYVVLDEDFSGKALTGVAPTLFSGGFDVSFRNRFSTSATMNYVDAIPLNDANTAFSDAYVLLGIRCALKLKAGDTHRLEVFAGVDNALDETYSLGNDLNAFGGRFYNAAMPRNYYAGLNLSLGKRM